MGCTARSGGRLGKLRVTDFSCSLLIAVGTRSQAEPWERRARLLSNIDAAQDDYSHLSVVSGCGQKQLVRGDSRGVQGEAFGESIYQVMS